MAEEEEEEEEEEVEVDMLDEPVLGHHATLLVVLPGPVLTTNPWAPGTKFYLLIFLSVVAT